MTLATMLWLYLKPLHNPIYPFKTITMRPPFNSIFTRTLSVLAGSFLLLNTACKKESAPNIPDQAKPTQTGKTGINAIGVTGPKSVCYVEVNNNDIRNVGNYYLS